MSDLKTLLEADDEEIERVLDEHGDELGDIGQLLGEGVLDLTDEQRESLLELMEN